jgi:beta-N-acetylhexosaminidase
MAFDLSPGPVMLDLEGDTALTAGDKKRLQHPLVGGVILFSRNYAHIDQLRELTRQIHALRTPPLLIAVDQEGGRVQRFRDGFTSLPCARHYGELYDHDPVEGLNTARRMGEVMASELMAVGVDLSFAPVLDVAQVESEVIGDRAFHSDPHVVSRLAGAFISGMGEAGMTAVGKHFPGHGGVRGDSHLCLPCDHRTLTGLKTCDLVPYHELVNRLGGVMTAHVLFDAVDGTTPTYSRLWIHGVLRRELGFKGVVFSDDLIMQGAGTVRDIVDRARAALDAGCNMILVCNDLTSADRILSSLQAPMNLLSYELWSTLRKPAG